MLSRGSFGVVYYMLSHCVATYFTCTRIPDPSTSAALVTLALRVSRRSFMSYTRTTKSRSIISVRH